MVNATVEVTCPRCGTVHRMALLDYTTEIARQLNRWPIPADAWRCSCPWQPCLQCLLARILLPDEDDEP